MILDTSALIAFIKREDGWEAIRDILRGARRPKMCAGTLTELLAVADNRFEAPVRADVERLLASVRVDVVPLTTDDAMAAADAYLRFGKGNHSARLNICDCFAYALAKRTGEPLLCVGNDFAQTDIPLVPLEPA